MENLNYATFHQDEKLVAECLYMYLATLRILDGHYKDREELEQIYFAMSLGHSLIYRSLRKLREVKDEKDMQYNFDLLIKRLKFELKTFHKIKE